MLTIDLHGLGLTEALEKMEKSILSAVKFNERLIRVIHGQGKHSEVFPVLKSGVRHWLEESELALTYVETYFRGEDGSPYSQANPGETIILLKGMGPLPRAAREEEEWEEEEFAARKNTKAMRAERLRKLRRRGPGR